MASPTSPRAQKTFARFQVARRLRSLREAKRLSLEQAARLIGKSRMTLARTESGEYEIELERVWSLCRVYGASSQVTSALATMAGRTTTPNGLVDDFGAEEWVGLYVDLERHATSLQIYQPELVPGPFQIEPYIRAVCKVACPPSSEERIEGQVKLRLERQRHLTAPETPLRVTAILGAGVLTRPVGGRNVLEAQIKYLCEISTLEHIDVRVLPWRAGAHAALASGPFITLGFPDEMDTPVVYLESHTGARYLEQASDLSAYRDLFAAVYASTIPIREYVDDQQNMDEVESLRRSG